MNTIPHPDDANLVRKRPNRALLQTLGMKPYDPRLLKASSDPLVRSVKKVRREWRKTPAGRLQTLLEEERKWKRRATIAANKLSEVRALINGFAAEMVTPEEEPKQ